MLRGTFIALPLVISLCWIFLFLFSRHKERKLFMILTLMFTTSFLTFFGYAILLYQAIELFTYYQYVFIISALSIYPLLYTYIELLTGTSREQKIIMYRLSPGIFLTMVTLLIALFIGRDEMKAYLHQFFLQQNEGYDFSFAGSLRIILYYVNHTVFYLQTVVYTYLTIRRILIFRKRIIWIKAGNRDKKLYFLHIFNLVILLILITGLLVFISNINHYNLPDEQLIIISIILSIMLLIVGIYGIRMFFSSKDFPMDILYLPINNKYIPMNKAQDIIELHKKEMLKKRILDLLEKKEIYKDPELRINDISKMLHTNRTYVSKTVNQTIGCNFSDFINSYRVEHTKKLLLENKLETMSLVEIAEKSGFSNMNSFYRAFRRAEGISPKQFLIQEMVSNISETQE